MPHLTVRAIMKEPAQKEHRDRESTVSQYVGTLEGMFAASVPYQYYPARKKVVCQKEKRSTSKIRSVLA